MIYTWDILELAFIVFALVSLCVIWYRLWKAERKKLETIAMIIKNKEANRLPTQDILQKNK